MNSPSAADALNDRLVNGPPILMDGGTGTEIERMGAAMHPTAWSARAALTDPDTVRSVHGAFLGAGAEIIIANTYPANYHVMAASGLTDEFEPANRRALELAHEAREVYRTQTADRTTWVAGSMSTTTFSSGLDQSIISTVHTPGEGYRAQANIIAEVDVDLIILEMMRDVTETRLCLDAAMETGLPVWLGLSIELSTDGDLALHGSKIRFADAVAQILDGRTALQAVGVMHSELSCTSDALETLSRLWDGPLFAYPHHGVFEMPHWRFDNTLAPEDFANAALDWIGQGATAVGGCCGIRPDHIAALRRRMNALRQP